MKKIFYGAAVLVWMVLIFKLSQQTSVESSELSNKITDWMLRAVQQVAPDAALSKRSLNLLLRKCAHFLVFFVLALLLTHVLRRIGLSGYRSAGLALLVCVLYAMTDELHQLFVSGRGAQVSDVLIDSAGAVAGILAYGLFYNFTKQFRHNKRLSQYR